MATTPLAGITVDAVREQLAQLGHTDVSEAVIADFLQQLATEGAGAAQFASNDDEDDEAEEDENEGEEEYGGEYGDEGGFEEDSTTTTPRATLHGAAYTTVTAAGDAHTQKKQNGTRPRFAKQQHSQQQRLAAPLKSPSTTTFDAAVAASTASPSTVSPAHKRAAHATPRGVHVTMRRGAMKGPSPR
jgi:ribosomal protein L12E/L44/L45/RPP1/RPP2